MSLTIEQFESVIAEAYQLDEEIDKYTKEVLGPKRQRLAELEAKILDELTRLDKQSYKSNCGTVVRQNRYSVQTPKTIEDKAALFSWLKDRGEEVYYQYVGVNSQQLNALYKQELEIAKEEGNLDFALPGVKEPTLMVSLARRKR